MNASSASVELESFRSGTGLLVNRLASRSVGMSLGARLSREWVRPVIALLDAAIGQIHHEAAAHSTLLEATSLLRKQVDPQLREEDRADGNERLLAWEVRKVVNHIDRHITNRVLVADLCALVRRSEAHFSRSFRRTLGHSPHAFVIRRRVELAAQCMLQSEASLSDIALECGFVDQAHFCKHFRRATGETPAAWRRACRARGEGYGTFSPQLACAEDCPRTPQFSCR
jgi:AraC family transcriptional regulator